MATLADVDEFGELLLVLVVIAAVGYLGKKVTDAVSSAKDILGFNATIGPNSFQGPTDPGTGKALSPKPLTAQQARAIAVLVTGSPTNYNLSPDATQVWFYDGSYYDNTSGHVFDKQGNDLGTLDAVQQARGGQVTSNADTSDVIDLGIGSLGTFTGKKKMASMAINVMDPVINQQPDSPTSTPGRNVLTSFETSALSLVNNVSQAALSPNGRMPYDPSDPNFQSLLQFRNTSGTAVNVGTSSPGLLIVILLLVVWLARGRRGSAAGSAGSVNR